MPNIYSRQLQLPKKHSFFIFGPRGTGKTTLVKEQFPDALYLNLLDTALYQEFQRDPKALDRRIQASGKTHIVLDEIQRLPELLNDVHRWIEDSRHTKESRYFILTGSSARKLKRSETNLLAGRAYRYEMHPLTAVETNKDFSIKTALQYGQLPSVYSKMEDPHQYLKSYIGVYLREEVQQEALVRNLARFSQFLETASFSQAQVLNVKKVGEDCGIDRKTAEAYFGLLEDLLLGSRIPIFQRRAKRRLVSHPKFFYFDTGVFRILRPRGPLDIEDEIAGASLETLFFQELRANISNLGLDLSIFYWRTSGASPLEVDFIVYGENGLYAFEIKRSSRWKTEDLKGLRAFKKDYPSANCHLLYLGQTEYAEDGIRIEPLEEFLKNLPKKLGLGQ